MTGGREWGVGAGRLLRLRPFSAWSVRRPLKERKRTVRGFERTNGLLPTSGEMRGDGRDCSHYRARTPTRECC